MRERRLAVGKRHRDNQSSEQRERRLAKDREYQNKEFSNETKEQRERRMARRVERQRIRLNSETKEQRERRLCKVREYMKRWKNRQRCIIHAQQSSSTLGTDLDQAPEIIQFEP